MRRGLFSVFVLVFGIAVLFQVFPEPKATAATDSIWSGDIVLESDEPWADDDFSYRNCVDGTISQDVYYRPRSFSIIAYDNFIYPTDHRIEDHEECLVQNKLGLFGGKYWSPDGNPSKVLEITEDNFTPVPGGNAVIIKQSSGTYPYGSTSASINYSLQGIGVLRVGYKGRSSSLRAYRQWDITSRAVYLQYDNDKPLLIRKWAFSSNGKYAVAALTTGTIIRINLDTQEIQPFAELSKAGRGWVMAISNDGDYALVYERNTTPPTFFNLTGCNTLYQKGYLPENSDTSGCTSRDLTETINSIYAGAASGYIRLGGFEPNSAGFTIGVAVNDAEGSRMQKLKFKPENYISRAQGYLAMGDSFTSGEGDTEGGVWYEPGTDEQGDLDTFEGRNLCHLSRRSYPYLMAIELGYLSNNTTSPPADGLFHSVACSGAKIQNITGNDLGIKHGPGDEDSFSERENQYRNDYFENLDRWQPGRIKQLDFTDLHVFGGYSNSEDKPEVITIGIGGNDAGFGEIITACASVGTCDQAIPRSVETTSLALTISALKPRLIETYKQIKLANPETRIYVHGYPIFVQGYDGNCGNNVHLDYRENALVEEGVKYINAIVEASAKEAGVFYVDVTNTLRGKNLCSGADDSDMAVNGVTAGNDVGTPWYADVLSGGYCFVRSGCLGKESYHPNPKAHVLYRDTILAQTVNFTKEMPEPQKTDFPLPDITFFGVTAHDAISSFNGVGNITDIVIPEPKPFLTMNQDNIGILQDGLLPNTNLTVSVHSEPIVIGEYEVDSNGVVNATVTLPEGLEPGSHQIHITGIDAFGNEIDYYEPIIIGESEDDFDGDGVLNEEDSCPVISNAFIDEDEDGIDDACDALLVQNTNGDQNNEEQMTKGQPSPETVAGTGEELAPQVLGSSTDSSNESLQNLGDKFVYIRIIYSLVILSVVVYMAKMSVQG